MWPFSKPESYLGVDIGSHGIKVVELLKRGKHPHLFTYGFADESIAIHADSEQLLDVDHIGAWLKQICLKSKTVSRRAFASLPAATVYSGYFTIPMLKKEDKQLFVEREVSKFLKQPIADTVLDWKVIQPAKKTKDAKETEEATRNKVEHILVTATSKKLIAAYTEIFRIAGLQLLSLESEVFGLITALVGTDTSPALLIDMGGEQTDFFIIDEGVPIFFRSVNIGGRQCTEVIAAQLGLDMGQAEAVKRDMAAERGGDALLNLLKKTLEPLVEEVSYSLEIYTKQKEQETARPEKIILTGGAALLPKFDALLSDRFAIKTYVGDPWSRVIYDPELQPVLESIGPRFSVALGMALRRLLQIPKV
ncbi:MAG: type IV pilus assembly protein PilM [Candidatus Magasanikbacteria bacterium]|nr:type IV pilus assembly protein PilM [Candidatus Magasanikbacteria bacterium]